MTSLDMNGVSLTVLKADGIENVMEYLDMPVSSPFWPKVSNLAQNAYHPVELHRT